MKRRNLWIALAITVILTAAPTLAGDRWLHIRVEESGDKPQTVRVNLPFSLLESVAPLIRDVHIDKGKVKLGEGDFNGKDLRSILSAVRHAEEGDYVTVETENENVRVTKSGRWLHVKVDDARKAKPEKVDVKVPLSVVEALLSGPSNELDFAAALQALKDEGDCELVAVHDGRSVVHMWVDGKNESR